MIEVHPKGYMYELINFGYSAKMEVYANSSLGILKLNDMANASYCFSSRKFFPGSGSRNISNNCG